MFLLRLKEIGGLSVKMADVSRSFLRIRLISKITSNDVPGNFVVKGMKCQNLKRFYHQKFLTKVVLECLDGKY